MSESIIRLSANDFDEAIDFLNLVFSQAYNPHDFAKILPKLYRPTDECMACNFAVRRNGRIRAIVGMFPMTLRAGGRTLRVAGIGGVSTHPNERGTGVMKQIMDACIEEMRLGGFHLSCLGGLRQRYAYYGYEKAGTIYSYNVTKNNIKHCFKDVPEAGIHFEPIGEEHHEWLLQAKDLYELQPVHCDRPLNEFYLYLKSWGMKPWAALDQSGRLKGYVVANDLGNQVNEIMAGSQDAFKRVMRAWVSTRAGDSAAVTLPSWSAEFIKAIDLVSESFHIKQSYNWRVFDWQEVVGALFDVKAGMMRISYGEANIGIEDWGTLRIKVKDGAASCMKIDGKPDFQCDSATAARLMFGPLSPAYFTGIFRELVPLLSSWFPLPLSWLPQDGV